MIFSTPTFFPIISPPGGLFGGFSISGKMTSEEMELEKKRSKEMIAWRLIRDMPLPRTKESALYESDENFTCSPDPGWKLYSPGTWFVTYGKKAQDGHARRDLMYFGYYEPEEQDSTQIAVRLMIKGALVSDIVDLNDPACIRSVPDLETGEGSFIYTFKDVVAKCTTLQSLYAADEVRNKVMDAWRKRRAAELNEH